MQGSRWGRLAFQGPSHGAVGVALFCRIPLVVKLLALCKSNLYLDALAAQVNLCRYTGHALRVDGALNFCHFFLVEKQLTRAFFFVIHDIAMGIMPNMHVAQSCDKSINIDPTVGEVAFAGSQALNFSSPQGNASLPRLTDRVLVVGFAIGCDNFNSSSSHSDFDCNANGDILANFNQHTTGLPHLKHNDFV